MDQNTGSVLREMEYLSQETWRFGERLLTETELLVK